MIGDDQVKRGHFSLHRTVGYCLAQIAFVYAGNNMTANMDHIDGNCAVSRTTTE